MGERLWSLRIPATIPRKPSMPKAKKEDDTSRITPQQPEISHLGTAPNLEEAGREIRVQKALT